METKLFLDLTADRKVVVNYNKPIVLGIVSINDYQIGYANNAIDECSSVALNVYDCIPSNVFMQLAHHANMSVKLIPPYIPL